MKDAAELDLGIVPESNHCEPCPPCGKSEEKPKEPRYPTLCFNGEHADLFREKYGSCAVGDEYEVTLRLRTKAASDGACEYEKKVEFNVVAVIGDFVEEESTEPEEKPESKPGRKLAKKKEVAAAY